MPLNGNDKETLTAICKLKDDASRARSSAAVKAVSVTDLSDFKRFVKTQYATGLNNTNGKPRCDAAARKAIGNGLWARICLLAAAVDSLGVVKELHVKGEAEFAVEADDKVEPERKLGGRQGEVGLVRNSQEARCRGRRPRRARGEAPASCPCRCASR